MERQKILAISSEEYQKGRIDSFKIVLSEELVYSLESLFNDFNFSKDVIKNLDMHYPSTKGHFFFYGPSVKAHMFFEDKNLNLVLDSDLKKEEMIQTMEKYFKFPNQE